MRCRQSSKARSMLRMRKPALMMRQSGMGFSLSMPRREATLSMAWQMESFSSPSMAFRMESVAWA